MNNVSSVTSRAATRGPLVSGFVIAIAVSLPASARAATCDSLKSLSLPATTIDTVQLVRAGSFAQPGGGAGQAGNTFADLPAFCRVAATLTPSSDSHINIEVWLPTENWNHKYQAVGNGGWSGVIRYADMAVALRRGYAASSTNAGHAGGALDASFAIRHPEKVIDFAYRSEHLMAVESKAIISAFYGTGPTYSYWNGCSAGGRQAMKEAQMFPADFDGIIAGSPGLDWSGRTAQTLRIAQLFENRAVRLSTGQLKRLHYAVLDACDLNDGLKDGLISNPMTCKFDAKTVECDPSGNVAADCLTPGQVDIVRTIYSPLKSGDREIPGLAYGSEINWGPRGWTGVDLALDHFRYLVFEDPAWNLSRFKTDVDPAKLEEGESGQIDARNANLDDFFARGGKLLHYHGWADPQISPFNSTMYYEQVVERSGGVTKIANSYRLFMAPGMAHCGGGEGPNDFDKVTALEQWVENGRAPDRIVASHSKNGVADRTRPLCPYPQLATYKGSGSIDEAASFACK